MKELVIALAFVLFFGAKYALIQNGIDMDGAKKVFQENVTVNKLVTFEESPEQKNLVNNSPNKKEEQSYVIEKYTAPNNWGTVSSELGFSLRYPSDQAGAVWGDDEYFQVGVVIVPLSSAMGEAVAEGVSRDLHNLNIFSGIMVTVIQDDPSVDLQDQIRSYLGKEGDRDRRGKLLSEEWLPITFAGKQGYFLERLIEGAPEQGSPHFLRKEIFVRSGPFLHRFSYLDAAKDTVFPRSGLAGKEFLENAGKLSEEILGTFAFDGSDTTSIVVPKAPPPPLTDGEKRHRDALLTELRKLPYFDESVLYDSPSNPCQTGTLSESTDNMANTLTLSPGIFFVGDEEYVDLHGYDEEGRHTGAMPILPGYPRPIIESRARGIDSVDLFSKGNGLILSENIDGRIELVGKKYGFTGLRLSGDGNSCDIAYISVPTTPYSVATISLTSAGGIGPISYDIDGDGIKDFEISLLHPLLQEKNKQIQAVIADMMKTWPEIE